MASAAPTLESPVGVQPQSLPHPMAATGPQSLETPIGVLPKSLPPLSGPDFRLIVLDVYIHSLVHITKVGGFSSPYPTGLLLECPNVPPTLLSIPSESQLSMECLTLLKLGRAVTLLQDRGVSLCLPVEVASSPQALFTLLGSMEGDMETPLHLGTNSHPLGPALQLCLGEGHGPHAWQTILTLKSLCGAITQLTLTLKATAVPRDLETFFAQQFAYTSTAAAAPATAAAGGGPTGRKAGGGGLGGRRREGPILPFPVPPPGGQPSEGGAIGATSTAATAMAAAAAAAAAASAAHTTSPPPLDARAIKWGRAELGSGSAREGPTIHFGPKGMLLSGVSVVAPPREGECQPAGAPWEANAPGGGGGASPSSSPPPPVYHLHPPAPPTASLDDLLADLIRLRDRVAGGGGMAPLGGSPGGGAAATGASFSVHRGSIDPLVLSGLGSSASMTTLQAALLETGVTQSQAASLVHTLGRLHVAEGPPETWRGGETVEIGGGGSGGGEAGGGEEEEGYLPFGTSPAMQRLAAWLPKSFTVLTKTAEAARAAAAAQEEEEERRRRIRVGSEKQGTPTRRRGGGSPRGSPRSPHGKALPKSAFLRSPTTSQQKAALSTTAKPTLSATSPLPSSS